MAIGSVSELDYHFLLAHDLGLVADGDYRLVNEPVQERKRMLVAFVRKIAADRDHAAGC